MHDFFEFLGIQVRPGDHVSTRQDRGKTVPLGKKKKTGGDRVGHASFVMTSTGVHFFFLRKEVNKTSRHS